MAGQSLLQSRWGRLLSLTLVVYISSYIDRSNFSFGVIGGMDKELGLTPGIISLAGSLFFLGYAICMIPVAHYAENKSAKRIIFYGLIGWGVLASLTGLATSVYFLIPVRFALGIAESIIVPGALIFISHWFTKKERSTANSILFSGHPFALLFMAAISGYLVQLVGWRWMFVIEGLPAVIIAIFWWNMVTDDPKDAKWLREEEKSALIAALRKEQEALRPVKNYWAAFKQSQTIFLALGLLFWDAGLLGYMLWLPTTIKQLAKTGAGTTGLLTAVPHLVSIITMLVMSRFSDKRLARKEIIWPTLILGALSFFGCYYIGNTNFLLSYVLLIITGSAMMAPIPVLFAIVPELLPRNVAGAAMALVQTCGALGMFFGTYLVGYLNLITGGLGASFVVMSLCLVCAVVCILCVKKPEPAVSVAGALAAKF